MRFCRRPGRLCRWRALHLGVLGMMVVLLSAFGCGAGGQGGNSSGPSTIPTFDQARAWSNLLAQTNLGPRQPGSAGHEACRQWLVAQLKALTDDVTEQNFSVASRRRQAALTGTNLLAVFGAAASTDLSAKALMLCAHWDTRPVADEDPDLSKRTEPVLGANDGASGVAVLLEVGRLLKAQTPSRPVILALWDLEDSGNLAATASLPWQGFCVGSQYFANHMGRLRPKESILLDMIGDTSPNYLQEPNSLASNPSLLSRVWGAGQSLGFTAFANSTGPVMTDDHLPLIRAGVPSLDIIDFDYPGPNSNRYWHTTSDTPDHCSADSLRMVGQTLLKVIYGE